MSYHPETIIDQKMPLTSVVLRIPIDQAFMIKRQAKREKLKISDFIIKHLQIEGLTK